MSDRTTLIITCHPSPASRCAHITRRIAELLEAEGMPVIVDDLAATGFNPVISLAELKQYYDDAVPADIAPLVAHLRRATDIFYILPLWMFDMPAILKGYFDRVFRPHVAFRFVGADIIPMLSHVRNVTVVVTHGRNVEETTRSGDGTQEFFRRSLPALLQNLESNARFDLYALDESAQDADGEMLSALWRHVTRTSQR